MSSEQMKTHRYPGVKPFSENERHVFYGRGTDTKKLYQLINLEKLVLLYSKSGLGKSSLLNAGVLPLFDEAEGYTIIKIRFGAYFDKSLSPVATSLFKFSETLSNPVLDKLGAGNDTLWLRMKALQHSNADVPKTYILVFDQFEELFTYREEDIKQFKRQLADLLYSKVPTYISKSVTNRLRKNPEFLSKEELEFLYRPPAVKVLLSMRSDRMSLLNTLADYLPDIQKNYYELKPLDRDAAIESIVKPAVDKNDIYLSPSFVYTTDCLNKILDYLTQSGQKSIETFQLQTVCQYAENLAIENKLHYDEKKQMLLAEPEILGDLQNIFRTQYDKLITNIEPIEKQLAARLLIEDKLIIDGNRISLPDVLVLKEKGIDKELLSYLQDKHHILRCEPNTTGGISYELSHDTLVAPILKAKKEREDKEELVRLEAERQEGSRQQKERIKKIRNRSVLAGIIGLIVLSLISVFAYTKSAEATRLKNLEYSQKLLVVSNSAITNLDYNSAALISRAAYLFYKENDGKDFRNFYNDMFDKLQRLDEIKNHQDIDSSFVFENADHNFNRSMEFINGYVYTGYDDGKILKTKWADSVVQIDTFFDFKKYTDYAIEFPQVKSISVNTNKNYLAAGGAFPFVQLFNLSGKSDESIKLKMPVAGNKTNAVLFTDDGNLLMLTDSALAGWNNISNKEYLIWNNKKQFNYQDGKFISLDAIPKEQHIHWNSNSLSVPGTKFNCMAVFKNLIAIGIDSGLVLIMKDSLIKIKSPGIGKPSSIQFNLKGDYLYIGSEVKRDDNSVYEFCKVKLTDFSIDINQNQEAIVNIICSHDGNFIATASWDGSVGIYNAKSNEEWKYATPLILRLPDFFSVTRIPNGIAFSANNKYLLAGYNNGEIYKWPLSADVIADLICERAKPVSNSVWGKYIDNKNSPVKLNRYNCQLMKK